MAIIGGLIAFFLMRKTKQDNENGARQENGPKRPVPQDAEKTPPLPYAQVSVSTNPPNMHVMSQGPALLFSH